MSQQRLDEADVDKIRRLRREHGLTYPVIAERLGISRAAARDAARGVSHRHLPGKIHAAHDAPPSPLQRTITDDMAHTIRRLRRTQAMGFRAIGVQVGVSEKIAREVAFGHRRKDLPGAISEAEDTAILAALRSTRKLDAETVTEARRRFADGERVVVLAEELGINQKSVRALLQGVTWGSVPGWFDDDEYKAILDRNRRRHAA